MQHKVIRVGKHSLAVIVPARFIHGLGIKAGDTVNVETNMNKGIVRLKFKGVMQLTLPTAKMKKKK